MMRFLFSYWLFLALCMASCTQKNARDQTTTQDSTNSGASTPSVDDSAKVVDAAEAAPAAEVASTPEATTTTDVESTPKTVASVRASPKKVSTSSVSSEESTVSTSTTYRSRSTRAGGYLCDSVEFIKYERLHDGEGGFMRGKALAYNSRQCGYVAAVVSKESPRPGPVATPVASQELMPPPEQWVADPLSPEKCEDGILYKFEKSAQTGVGRKVKIGVCAVEAAKPDYLNKSIQQVKDDGLIKKGESGTRKKDN